MDAIRGMNPSSSMFQTQASRNLSQIGFGAVRNQKEVAQQDDDQVQMQDQVKLTVIDDPFGADDVQEMADNAAMSGEIGELVDDDSEDQEEVNERRFRFEEDEKDKMAHGGQVNYLKNVEQVNRLNQMDDPTIAVNEILKDVPETSLGPARNIVANQVQNGRPTESLVAMKPVEGTNAVDFAPAEPVGLLDIHDTNNKPMPQDFESEVSNEELAAKSADYLNEMIESLPADQKGAVDEMRNALNNRMDQSGDKVGAQAAFASLVHDLADGWDNEGLKAACDLVTSTSGAGVA